MKTIITILALAVITLVFLGGFFYGRHKVPASAPAQLTLEQVLSIRELHLVRHTYTDLFFLHRKNDETKAIRAIVQMPVEVTAHLNLKEIQLVKQGDSIKQIMLPRATVGKPHFQVDNMVIRQTRGLQLYAGQDLYPLVGSYLQTLLAERVINVRTMAITHRIQAQAEIEGKEYIEGLLKSISRSDILVIFVDQVDKKEDKTLPIQGALPDAIPFGFIPIQVQR